MLKARVYSLLAVLLLLAAGLYYLLQSESRNYTGLSTLKVGILPDESIEQLQARFSPLLDYLAAETGLEFRFVESSDYDELVGLFIEDKVDLAYFGGYTFVQSYVLHGAVPLVMRGIDTRFTSYFLVAGDNSAQSLEDFRGKSFSFGNRLSTSGHMMPRHFMQQNQKIVPEKFFGEVGYSGAHDKTAFLVRDGDFDLGVANAAIIRSMLRDGRLHENDLNIIRETPPYADYVWAVQAWLPEEVKIQLRDAFLALDINDDHEGKILRGMDARVFLPAGIGDFEALIQIAQSMQLLPGDTK